MYGYGGNVIGGAGVFGFLACLVLFVDLVLVGVWLWKQITKK